MSCITSTASPQPAIRAAVASQCGCKIPAGLAFGLLKSRYAACVLAHVPHASLIGEDGDLANCCAVLSKRRSRRLSRRSARANSCVTHSTDSVPAAMIACTSGSSQRLDLPKRFAMLRRTSRRPLHYARHASVSSAFNLTIKISAKIARDVCNRKVRLHHKRLLHRRC